ncbi:MAG: NAD(P)/FAD-dependent oxidoreductase [Candidatus Rifleibacteriota bacterium]
MMAAIVAARRGKNVVVIEKLKEPGAKLRASGGGRCNLTNTLEKAEFINRFGREGKFMIPALNRFDQSDLRDFLAQIGVKTHAPDGLRVFPVTHAAATVTEALENEMKRLGVRLVTQQRAQKIISDGNCVRGVITDKDKFFSGKILIACGGAGYPCLGTSGDGYELARSLGHKISDVFPAMLPLKTKEKWVANCRANTIGKAEIRINLKKYAKLHAVGDLIFSIEGIRGPVVLDFSREITPILSELKEVPIKVKLVAGMNEEQVRNKLKEAALKHPNYSIDQLIATFLPGPLAKELCLIANASPGCRPGNLPGEIKENLIKTITWTPLTIVGHEGFASAMVTRGGVKLKEVNPETLESRIVKGLYFSGEILDLDGPCGGFNLQWAFSSGYLAGLQKSTQDSVKS